MHLLVSIQMRMLDHKFGELSHMCKVLTICRNCLLYKLHEIDWSNINIIHHCRHTSMGDWKKRERGN